MGIYSGLTGVAGSIESNEFHSSVTGYLNALKTSRIASGSGDNGSVTVWIDDEGMYRCALHRYQSVVDEQVYKTKIKIKEWLKKWLPKIGNGEILADSGKKAT